MRILFSGGGTLGSVTPLIAIIEELRKRGGADFHALWVCTRQGVERGYLRDAHIPFRKIFTYKLRRYADLRNIIELPFLAVAFVQAFWIIARWRPEALISAGGYVSVPLHVAAWFLRIPTLIHAQDIRVGLANRIMALFAEKITVAFPVGLRAFGERAILTGNPVRTFIFNGDRGRALKYFHLDPQVSTVLVLGGGTGALELNRAVVASLDILLENAQIIHVTGHGKEVVVPQTHGRLQAFMHRYHPLPFLGTELADAYAAADIVVSRAGIGTLSEIAAVALPAVLVPIASSHQEENARYFESKGAARVVRQSEIKKLAGTILELLRDPLERLQLGRRAQTLARRGATEAVADHVEEMVEK